MNINGYISATRISGKGKHLVCTLRDPSRPEDRFELLEPVDAEVPTGTDVVNGVFEYAVDSDGNTIAPDKASVGPEGEKKELTYHIGYLVDAEKITVGKAGVLARRIADQA